MYLSSMDGIFTKSFPVPGAAIDAQGHVNNIVYLQWMQDIAIDHTTAVGWPMERYISVGCAWVARSHYIEYLRPAFKDEPITIYTWISGMEHKSCPRHYLFTRDTDRAVLGRAKTVWVYVDMKSGRAIPIPEDMRASFPFHLDPPKAEAALGF